MERSERMGAKMLVCRTPDVTEDHSETLTIMIARVIFQPVEGFPDILYP